jgi:alpha-tubulin suppressor-like RCC1 family protein
MASELLMLLAAGKAQNVWTWGYNGYGMNGQNTLGGPINEQLTLIATSATIVPSQGGYSNAGYIKSNGTLWMWGSGSDGELGLNNTESRSSPSQVGALTNWNQLAIGFFYALARKTDGTIWSWGRDDYGQLGINSQYINYSSPVQIGTLTTWTHVAASQSSSYAIKGGALWVWGANFFGQLGKNTIIDYSAPTQVGALTTWSKISVGSNFTAGITTAGALWMWGYNVFGQLGSNTTIDRSSPVQVTGGGVWLSVALSRLGTAAVKSGGTLWQWGEAFGLVPANSAFSTPTQIGADTNWASVYSSSDYNAYVAIKTNGTAWTWGANIPTITTPYDPYSDNFGDTTIRSSPTQIGSATNWAEAYLVQNAIILKDTSNNLYSVGFNDFGQLGTSKILYNTTTSPVNIGSAKYADGACSQSNALFIKKTDRTLWESGARFYPITGGLYATPGTLYSSPVQIGLSSNWKKVFPSCGSNYALTTTKDLYAWGDNTYGQLGINGGGQYVSNPTQISGTWEDLTQSNVNCEHSLAYKFSPISGIYAWGRNTYGQVGVNNTISYSSPVLVGNITSQPKKLAANTYNSAFVSALGELYTWGYNLQGQLGVNNRINSSNPVQVAGALYNDVSIGENFMTAVRTNGTLWAWGNNLFGQLGQNNTTRRSSPVQIGSDTNWKQVFAGQSYWIATKTDGTVWACGLIITAASPFSYTETSSPVQVSSNFSPSRGSVSQLYNAIFVK